MMMILIIHATIVIMTLVTIMEETIITVVAKIYVNVLEKVACLEHEIEEVDDGKITTS